MSITYEKRGPAAWIAVDGSAIDAAFVRELQAACESVAADAAVRAVVIAGSFVGEGDALALAGDPFACLCDLRCPVIAAAAGEVGGAGLALALAADIRIAGDNASFVVSDLGRGRLPLGGAVQRLSRLVGRGKALELLLTGEPVDAANAHRIGLVSEVVPAASVAERAGEIAARMAERGPLALQYAKEAVTRGLEMPLEQALRYETDLTIILQTTEDRAEGVQAFKDKRNPEFKGE